MDKPSSPGLVFNLRLVTAFSHSLSENNYFQIFASSLVNFLSIAVCIRYCGISHKLGFSESYTIQHRNNMFVLKISWVFKIVLFCVFFLLNNFRVCLEFSKLKKYYVFFSLLSMYSSLDLFWAPLVFMSYNSFICIWIALIFSWLFAGSFTKRVSLLSCVTTPIFIDSL